MNQSGSGLRVGLEALACATMDVETAIRTRRTHKAYVSEPLSKDTLVELLELARWAPNYPPDREPWRFRVLGPETTSCALSAAGQPNEAEKLRRAPTLVAASARQDGDDQQNREVTRSPPHARSTSCCSRRAPAGSRLLLAHACPLRNSGGGVRPSDSRLVSISLP